MDFSPIEVHGRKYSISMAKKQIKGVVFAGSAEIALLAAVYSCRRYFSWRIVQAVFVYTLAAGPKAYNGMSLIAVPSCPSARDVLNEKGGEKSLR